MTCFLYSAVGYQGSSHPPTRWLNQSSRSSNQRSTSSSTISGFSPRRTNSCLLLSLSVSNNRLKFATTGYGTLRVSRYVALHGFFLLGSKCRTRVSYPPLLSPQELSWRAHSLMASSLSHGGPYSHRLPCIAFGRLGGSYHPSHPRSPRDLQEFKPASTIPPSSDLHPEPTHAVH